MSTSADRDMLFVIVTFQAVAALIILGLTGCGNMKAAGDSMTRMMEPTLSWIPIFQDVAGDGYYFDPKRTADEGAILDNFRETADYTFFPSIKNVIAGFVECYEEECYFIGTDDRVDGDFEAASKVWTKYGSSSEGDY